MLAQYSLTVADLLQLVNDFLSDEVKGQLFELEHFKKLSSHVRCRILQEVSNSEIKRAVLENPSVASDLENYHIFCPEIKICDNLGLSYSTVQEYINAEMWIASVFKEMDENWSSIQKIAYIDNAIGKKISYSPDFDTEFFNPNDSRTLWKIIDSGYGVCNGIAQVEKYMLGQME